MRKSVLTKATATAIAVLTILFTLCFTSSAANENGGADIYLNGKRSHCDTICEAWKKVAEFEGTATIRLKEDWVADEDGSFGTGTGFYNGAISIVNKNMGLIFDLNGYKVDRGLTEERDQGYVFFIRNSINVMITDRSGCRTGTITGGYNSGNAGGIRVVSSVVRITDLNLTNNISKDNGGVFYIVNGSSSSTQYSAEVIIDRCNIYGNSAKTGGAAYVEIESKLRVFDTTITNNKAVNDGGIHAEVSWFRVPKITLGGKVIIADNVAEKDGTGLTLDESLFRKAIVEYDSDKPLSEGSRIVILSKTGDKTLRITANSDKSYINCYEYENNTYKIVEKTDGSAKYLDIKKN